MKTNALRENCVWLGAVEEAKELQNATETTE